MNDFTVLEGIEVSPFNYVPPGPVANAFLHEIHPIHLIMGPWGSGKTTTAVVKTAAVSLQFPQCRDGVIRVRGAILRDNFRTLYRTTLESWFKTFPKDFPDSKFEGGQDRPFKHTIRFRTPKGRRIEMIVDGFGIGDHAIEELLKGYQPSWFWLNEADLMGRRVPSWCYGRLGRYPSADMLADPTQLEKMPRTVFGDLNPPLISHYINEDFCEKPREGHVLCRQPSGLSPDAENKIGHPRANYEKMAATMSGDEVRRFVHGNFGLVGDGALVYPEYDFSIHCSNGPLQPLDMPLLIGSDAGGSPALVIGQYTPKGHMRWLDELVTEPGTGVGRFCEYLIDLLQSKYRGLPIAAGWGDPSAFYGADRAAGELSFMETLGRAINLNILPTPTNDPVARQESVDWFIRRKRDRDGVPYFQHSPTMKVTQAGFQGGFMVQLNPHNTAGRIRFVKNKYSHVHEGGMYLCYGVRGHAGMINDAARAGRAGNVVQIRAGAKPNSNFSGYD